MKGRVLRSRPLLPIDRQGMGMQTLIAWLPALLCPLMMLFCVVPMLRGRGGCKKGEGGELTSEQVRERLAQLQREELALRERLVADELDQGRPVPHSVSPNVGSDTRSAER